MLVAIAGAGNYLFDCFASAAVAVDSSHMTASSGYIESAEQSRTAEQNKISKLTVKLQIISTEHDCRM